MSEPAPTESTLAVRHWLERHRAGDEAARNELINISMRRLRLLARTILSDIPAVRQFEETDDLLQNAVVRLWKYLAGKKPDAPVDYFRLAACMIRRELIDLSRHHCSQRGTAFSDSSSAAAIETPVPRASAPNHDTSDPQTLSQWTEFHEYVENLPEDERSLFDLLWYQGLTMADTSELLNLPLRSLGRRWKTARVRLYRALLDDSPGSDAIPWAAAANATEHAAERPGSTTIEGGAFRCDSVPQAHDAGAETPDCGSAD